MKNLGIVYWSGTGNTEIMANCIAEGAKEAGAEVTMMGPADFSADRFKEFSAVAFGCPAMGSEVLEEADFEPMFADIEGQLTGKRIALFGSYGWGDGEWMRTWYDRCDTAGANLFADEGLVAHETPDEEAEEACRKLGRDLAN